MSKDEEVNGARIAAQILSRMKPDNRERVVKAMTRRAPEIMIKVKEAIFTFNDIPNLNAQGLQLLANTVEHRDLVLSLADAPKPVAEAFLTNMSGRKAQIISEDIAVAAQKGSPKDIEGARKRILDIIEKLRSEGQIRSEDNQDIWV